MKPEKKSILPGLSNISNTKKPLESLLKVKDDMSSSVLPIMAEFSKVKPYRRVIKQDGTIRQEVKPPSVKARKILKPGFSGNMFASYNVANYVEQYEPEAAAFFAEVESDGNPIPEYIKTGFNNLILREKFNNRLSKLRRAYPYLGGKVNSAKIDAISLDRAIPINLQDSDIGTNVGLTTDGISSALVDSTNAVELLTDPLTMSWGFFAKGNPLNYNGFPNGIWDGRSGPTYITTRMSRRVYCGKTTVYAPLVYYADNNASFIGAKYGVTPVKGYMKNDLYDNQGASTTVTSFNAIKPDAQWVVCGATWAYTGTEPNLIYFNGQTNLFDFLAFGFTEEELLGFRESVFLYLNEINAYA